MNQVEQGLGRCYVILYLVCGTPCGEFSSVMSLCHAVLRGHCGKFVSAVERLFLWLCVIGNRKTCARYRSVSLWSGVIKLCPRLGASLLLYLVCGALRGEIMSVMSLCRPVTCRFARPRRRVARGMVGGVHTLRRSFVCSVAAPCSFSQPRWKVSLRGSMPVREK